jgi:hypothetical protein
VVDGKGRTVVQVVREIAALHERVDGLPVAVCAVTSVNQLRELPQNDFRPLKSDVTKRDYSERLFFAELRGRALRGEPKRFRPAGGFSFFFGRKTPIAYLVPIPHPRV